MCANDQVIRATSPHTAPVRGPCHSHGAATPLGLGGNLWLRGRGRRWWWRWNWNTHTYLAMQRKRQSCRKSFGRWGTRTSKNYPLFTPMTASPTSLHSHTHTHRPGKKRRKACTHLGLCTQGSVRSCSGSAPALRTSAAGKQTARSPVWQEYPAPGTHPQSECQLSCCHGNTGKVRDCLAVPAQVKVNPSKADTK